MIYLLYTIHVLVCLFLMLVILLQAGKGGGVGALGGATSQQVFGGRGASSFLERLTTATAIVFMLTALTLSYINSQSDSVKLQKTAQARKKKDEQSAKKKAEQALKAEVEKQAAQRAVEEQAKAAAAAAAADGGAAAESSETPAIRSAGESCRTLNAWSPASIVMTRRTATCCW